MGLEDAAVLSRCIDTGEEWSTAILRYERTRIGRASKIQLGSNQNEWLLKPGNPDWVYGYDAWSVVLNSSVNGEGTLREIIRDNGKPT